MVKLHTAELGGLGFKSKPGSLLVVVLPPFVPVFLACRMKLVIILTTYGIVKVNNETMYVKCLAQLMQLFHK